MSPQQLKLHTRSNGSSAWLGPFICLQNEVEQTLILLTPACLLLHCRWLPCSLWEALWFSGCTQLLWIEGSHCKLQVWFLPCEEQGPISSGALTAASGCKHKTKASGVWAKDHPTLRLQTPSAAKSSCLCSHFCVCNWAKHSSCQSDGILQQNASKISKVCIVSMSSSHVPQEFLPTLLRKFSSS